MRLVGASLCESEFQPSWYLIAGAIVGSCNADQVKAKRLRSGCQFQHTADSSTDISTEAQIIKCFVCCSAAAEAEYSRLICTDFFILLQLQARSVAINCS